MKMVADKIRFELIGSPQEFEKHKEYILDFKSHGAVGLPKLEVYPIGEDIKINTDTKHYNTKVPYHIVSINQESTSCCFGDVYVDLFYQPRKIPGGRSYKVM